MLALKKPTTVVFVFDTDTGKIDTLKNNIEMVKKCANVDGVICVIQNRNLEDELLRACSIRQIKELTNSISNSGYKHDLIAMNNLASKLEEKNFSIDKMWMMQPPSEYNGIKNEAEKIKLK